MATMKKIIAEVKEILADILDLKKNVINLKSKIMDFDPDSMDNLEMIIALEEKFKVSIVDEEAIKLATVGRICRYIHWKLNSSWLKRPNFLDEIGGERIRIFQQTC